jgi:hypothetical protein
MVIDFNESAINYIFFAAQQTRRAIKKKKKPGMFTATAIAG